MVVVYCNRFYNINSTIQQTQVYLNKRDHQHYKTFLLMQFGVVILARLHDKKNRNEKRKNIFYKFERQGKCNFVKFAS